MLFFSHWPGMVTAHISKFVGLQHQKKKTFERRQCIPNMRFVREEAYSSAYWFIWRYEGRDYTIYLKYRAQLSVRFRPSDS